MMSKNDFLEWIHVFCHSVNRIRLGLVDIDVEMGTQLRQNLWHDESGHATLNFGCQARQTDPDGLASQLKNRVHIVG